MATPWPENLSTNRVRVIKVLAQGQESATHLQLLLKKPYGEDVFLLDDKLVVKIMRSFTEALSLLTSSDFVEILQNQTTSQVDSVCCDDRRSRDSGESKKRPTAKDRRVATRESKKTSQSFIRASSTIEDGYAWRKYGQKEILNAKYPRSYFRCTHKYDQGCKATKQVQRMEEDPQMYRTTILVIIPAEISQGSTNHCNTRFCFDPWESYMLTSDSNIPTQLDHQRTTIKQEHKEEPH
ncbi:hypothetical protein GH714_014479 [Hevea brasiliensis]|uniref:WRKY domain-containing protein n=1 Tax=Hevea brasiliensis TaxID=3981 RepID=A0A6A6N0S5_HEVBR|nr:hypothetical protein GH714_014479 [Hevea brasiliensis]